MTALVFLGGEAGAFKIFSISGICVNFYLILITFLNCICINTISTFRIKVSKNRTIILISDQSSNNSNFCEFSWIIAFYALIKFLKIYFSNNRLYVYSDLN